MVDQFLGGLFGSQPQDDPTTRRQRAKDFIDRHERGAHGQMPDAEVLQNYRAATANLSPAEYQQAATQALHQMTPEQRREMRHYLRHSSNNQINPTDDSPEAMAQAMGQGQQGSGGLLSHLGLGGSSTNPSTAGGGGLPAVFDNLIAKVALAGVAAMAAKTLTDPNR